MKIYLEGNEYKYAAEQILLMMFPEERPEYPDGNFSGEENSCLIKVTRGVKFATASAKICRSGKSAVGVSKTAESGITDKLTEDRLLQKIIKLAFYKAAAELTGTHPAWGALTGIRPGKLVTNMLESGSTEEAAIKRMCRDFFVSPERAALCLDTAKAGIAVKNSLDERDIAIYVGIPFCPTRCAYCSFVSHSVEKSMKLIQPFLEALEREIEETAETVKKLGLRVISVYMGGGTPTTISAQQMDRLLKKIAECFDLSAVTEYTVEAGRPDTITPEKLNVLRNNGVTRVSINPQTMSNKVLQTIGRRHTAAEVIDAYHMARDAGIGAVNMDLIAGLPADNIDSFRNTLDTVLELDPENVTVHTLSLKKGTKITLEGTELPSPDEVGEMLDYAAEKLRANGYVPYYLYRQKFMSGGFENVGWCKPGFESLYNILIMEELCTILALGGGGSTKLTAPKKGKIQRVFNAKYPYEYINSMDKIISSKRQIEDFYNNEVLGAE